MLFKITLFLLEFTPIVDGNIILVVYSMDVKNHKLIMLFFLLLINLGVVSSSNLEVNSL